MGLSQSLEQQRPHQAFKTSLPFSLERLCATSVMAALFYTGLNVRALYLEPARRFKPGNGHSGHSGTATIRDLKDNRCTLHLGLVFFCYMMIAEFRIYT